MSGYIKVNNDKKKVKDIFANINGVKRKIVSGWCSENGVVKKVFGSGSKSMWVWCTYSNGSKIAYSECDSIDAIITAGINLVKPCDDDLDYVDVTLFKDDFYVLTTIGRVFKSHDCVEWQEIVGAAQSSTVSSMKFLNTGNSLYINSNIKFFYFSNGSFIDVDGTMGNAQSQCIAINEDDDCILFGKYDVTKIEYSYNILKNGVCEIFLGPYTSSDFDSMKLTVKGMYYNDVDKHYYIESSEYSKIIQVDKETKKITKLSTSNYSKGTHGTEYVCLNGCVLGYAYSSGSNSEKRVERTFDNFAKYVTKYKTTNVSYLSSSHRFVKAGGYIFLTSQSHANHPYQMIYKPEDDTCSVFYITTSDGRLYGGIAKRQGS